MLLPRPASKLFIGYLPYSCRPGIADCPRRSLSVFRPAPSDHRSSERPSLFGDDAADGCFKRKTGPRGPSAHGERLAQGCVDRCRRQALPGLSDETPGTGRCGLGLPALPGTKKDRSAILARFLLVFGHKQTELFKIPPSGNAQGLPPDHRQPLLSFWPQGSLVRTAFRPRPGSVQPAGKTAQTGAVPRARRDSNKYTRVRAPWTSFYTLRPAIRPVSSAHFPDGQFNLLLFQYFYVQDEIWHGPCYILVKRRHDSRRTGAGRGGPAVPGAAAPPQKSHSRASHTAIARQTPARGFTPQLPWPRAIP